MAYSKGIFGHSREALCNVRKFSQIELVVEFDRRWQKVVHHECVQFDRCIDKLAAHFRHFGVENRQVSIDDLSSLMHPQVPQVPH